MYFLPQCLKSLEGAAPSKPHRSSASWTWSVSFQQFCPSVEPCTFFIQRLFGSVQNFKQRKGEQMLNWCHEANQNPGDLLSPAFCPLHSRKTIWSLWGEPDAEVFPSWFLLTSPCSTLSQSAWRPEQAGEGPCPLCMWLSS